MTLDSGPNKVILQIIKSESNGHVVINQGATDPSYHLLCTVCMSSYHWTTDYSQKYLGLDLDILYEFCKLHKHPKVYDPETTWGDYYENKWEPTGGASPNEQTASGGGVWKNLGPATISNPVPANTFPSNVPPEITYKIDSWNPFPYNKETTGKVPVIGQYEDYTTIDDIMSQVQKDLQNKLKESVALLGGPANQAQSAVIQPEQLKSIWQWSEFNVDLKVEAESMQCYIVCNVCKGRGDLDWHKVKQPKNPVWTEIEAWCRGHKSCGTAEIKSQKGRKFKDVSD